VDAARTPLAPRRRQGRGAPSGAIVGLIFMENWAQLLLVWKDAFPVECPRKWSLLEKLACTVVVDVSTFSLGNVKQLVRKQFPGSRLFMDLYVITWLVVLILILNTGLWLGRTAAVLIAAYRIVDIVNYRLLFLLLKSETKPWATDVIRRSVVIAFTNFIEVVIAFATIYLQTGSIVQDSSKLALSNPTDALYFSSVTMTTLGYGDFLPTDATGRWLVMAQISTTIVFLIFLLPALVSVFSPALTNGKAH
jgi:hypothetical protein